MLESEELVSTHLAGATIRRLARIYDIHRCTVQVHLDRAGIKRQTTSSVLTDVQIDDAAGRYRDGQSWATIAEIFKVHPSTVGRALKLRGVKMRPRRGGPQS